MTNGLKEKKSFAKIAFLEAEKVVRRSEALRMLVSDCSPVRACTLHKRTRGWKAKAEIHKNNSSTIHYMCNDHDISEDLNQGIIPHT